MSQKRKVYSPKLRSQVALAAIRGDKTIREAAQRCGVSPQMVIKMKSRLLDQIEENFFKTDGQPRRNQVPVRLSVIWRNLNEMVF